jgi:hypothetical protein
MPLGLRNATTDAAIANSGNLCHAARHSNGHSVTEQATTIWGESSREEPLEGTPGEDHVNVTHWSATDGGDFLG